MKELVELDALNVTDPEISCERCSCQNSEGSACTCKNNTFKETNNEYLQNITRRESKDEDVSIEVENESETESSIVNNSKDNNDDDAEDSSKNDSQLVQQNNNIDEVNHLKDEHRLELPLRREDEEEEVKFFIGDDQQTCTPRSPDKESASVLLPPPSAGTATFVPPDGGIGWVVVIAACISNCFAVGFLKSYSILYSEIIRSFPDSSAYKASWIPAMLSTLGLLISPAIGVLCRQYTSRKVSALGGVLCFIGLFSSTFVTSLTQLIFTLGVITGLGSGFAQTPGILITSLYFDKRRALAAAICVSGNALGSFFMPPLMDALLYEYNLRGTFFIISALMTHIIAASLFYRPVHVHGKIQERERRKKALLGSPDPVVPKRDSFTQRALNSKILSKAKLEETELTRRVSFLRSTSVLSSVPDLVEYARSWSVIPAMESTDVPMTSYQPLQGKRNRTVSESARTRVALNDIPDGSTIFMSNNLDGSGYKKKSSSGINISQVPSKSSLARYAITRQSSLRHPHSFKKPVLYGDLQEGIPSKVSLAISESTIQEEEEGDEDLLLVNDLNKQEALIVAPTPSGSQALLNRSVPSGPMKIKSQVPEGKPSILSALSKSFDINIMKRPKMIVMSISVFLASAGAPHCLFYLHSLAQSVGLNPAVVSKILSISAAVDLVARLSAGVISDLNIIPDHLFYSLSLSAAGLATLCLPMVSSFSLMAVLLSVYGIGVGGWFVLIPTILGKSHGVENLAASYGFIRFCMGMMNFISPQISGTLVDAFGSHAPSYYFMGGSMLTGALLSLLVPYLPPTTEEKMALSAAKLKE